MGRDIYRDDADRRRFAKLLACGRREAKLRQTAKALYASDGDFRRTIDQIRAALS